MPRQLRIELLLAILADEPLLCGGLTKNILSLLGSMSQIKFIYAYR
jgi:hypothetical protein